MEGGEVLGSHSHTSQMANNSVPGNRSGRVGDQTEIEVIELFTCITEHLYV